MAKLAVLEPFVSLERKKIGPYFVANLVQFMFKTNVL